MPRHRLSVNISAWLSFSVFRGHSRSHNAESGESSPYALWVWWAEHCPASIWHLHTRLPESHPTADRSSQIQGATSLNQRWEGIRVSANRCEANCSWYQNTISLTLWPPGETKVKLLGTLGPSCVLFFTLNPCPSFDLMMQNCSCKF